MTKPCGLCGGTGAIGGGWQDADGYSTYGRCGSCDGYGDLVVNCDCGKPAVHPEVDGLLASCEECSPGGCHNCRAWGRECCREHRRLVKINEGRVA